MALHHETGWCQVRQGTGASLHVEHAFAEGALEVVVVPQRGRFIARWFAGDLHRAQRTFVDHSLELAVDGGNRQAGNCALRDLQHLARQQRPARLGQAGFDRASLCGPAFHLTSVVRYRSDDQDVY
jgi:hypothetical protein